MESVTLVIDALKWAFKTFADNLVLYMKLFVISNLIALVSIMLFFCIILFVTQGNIVPSSGIMPLQLIGALWLYLVPFYLTLCYINVALLLYEGQSVPNVRQFFIDWRLFAKSFVALFLYSLSFAIGMICFIIPGLIVASLFYYIIYCIMVDDTGIIDAFTCSLQLTKKQPLHSLMLVVFATMLGASWFLLPVAALMNVYAYKQRQNSIAYDV